MKQFSNLLERIIEDNNLDTSRIYNADETGLTKVQKKPTRVVSMKGKSKIVPFQEGRGEYIQQPYVVSAMLPAMYLLC